MNTKQRFSVLSISEDGQINLDHVIAIDTENAIGIVARRCKNEQSREFVAVLPGHVSDGDTDASIYFPGQCSVYTEDAITIDKQ